MPAVKSKIFSLGILAAFSISAGVYLASGLGTTRLQTDDEDKTKEEPPVIPEEEEETKQPEEDNDDTDLDAEDDLDDDVDDEDEVVKEEDLHYGKQYSKILTDIEKRKLITKDTDDEKIKNIILGRLFPHYRKKYKSTKNKLFKGSPKIVLQGEELVTKDDKTFYIMGKNDSTDVGAYRDACVKALEDTSQKEKNQLARLRRWCTIPTIKDNLLLNKFKLATTDDDFKTILKSDWFKDGKYADKQSFLTEGEITDKDENTKVQKLKEICKSTLQKSFTRNNYPAPRDLLENLKENKNRGEAADEFQEAALFCTIPKTAEDYVTKTMKGSIYDKVPEKLKNDYCYEKGKDINYYKGIKTTDPMNGKTFWCAVSMLHEKYINKKTTKN